MKRFKKNRDEKLFALFCVLILLAVFLLPAAAGQAPDPSVLADLSSAVFCWNPPEGMFDPRFGDSFQVEITDRERLSALETLLSQASLTEGRAGCPFYGAAKLKLKTARGQQISLELAWDSCSIFRWGEYEYNYKPLAFRDRYDVYPSNDVLFDLFTWQEKARNLNGNDLSAVEALYSEWISVHGQPWLWTFETWVRFTHTFEPLARDIASPEANGPLPDWLRLTRRHYTWNGKGDLSCEDAVSLASKAVRKQFGFSQEEMWNFIPYARFARLDPGRSEWLIHFLKGEDPKGAPYARLDAKTGRVLEIGRWPEKIEQIISFLE